MKGLTKKENEWWGIYQQRDIAYRADAEEFEGLLKSLAKCRRVIKKLEFEKTHTDSENEPILICPICGSVGMHGRKCELAKLLKGVEW
jgi:hypothetical protein